MKYINRFSTNAEYQSFTEGERYITPNVCYINETSGVTMKPYVSPKIMITFTINEFEHQAEEGMTWQEWCDSEYNVDGFRCSGNLIIIPGVSIGGQTPSDVICNGCAYRTIATGSSGGSD
jgi:hypothetical protein